MIDSLFLCQVFIPLCLYLCWYFTDRMCSIGFEEMNIDWDEIKGDFTLKLNDLIAAPTRDSKGLKPIEIICTTQCAGNRNHKYQESGSAYPVIGYISTTKWKGILIADIIEHYLNKLNTDKQQHYGKKSDHDISKYKYVTFYGNDCDTTGIYYAMSVPLDHVLNKHNECIIAYEMNDQVLPRDHGYPMRVIIPGVAGCRSVKWLKRIQLTQDPVESPWQKDSYKINGKNGDTTTKHVFLDMPVTSIITNPTGNSVIDININNTNDTSDVKNDQTVEISGIAYCGGGRGIIRVECSIDGGKNWHECELTGADQEMGKQWCWTLWKCQVDIPESTMKEIEEKGQSQLDITCRAMDSSFNSQPSKWQHIDNGTYYGENIWHHVLVGVQARIKN